LLPQTYFTTQKCDRNKDLQRLAHDIDIPTTDHVTTSRDRYVIWRETTAVSADLQHVDVDKAGRSWDVEWWPTCITDRHQVVVHSCSSKWHVHRAQMQCPHRRQHRCDTA